jgi:hypothetical protein
VALWICKNCSSVGSPSWGSTTRGNSAPACSSCGHKTIVPIDSPKGSELARKAGFDERALRLSEWRDYSKTFRYAGIAVGIIGVIGSIATRPGILIGIWIVLPIYGVASLYLHARNAPKD